MAYFDNSFLTDRLSLRQRVARLFDTPFDRRARQMSSRIRELRAMSDDELAAQGIARDAIPALVLTGKLP